MSHGKGRARGAAGAGKVFWCSLEERFTPRDAADTVLCEHCKREPAWQPNGMAPLTIGIECARMAVADLTVVPEKRGRTHVAKRRKSK